MKITETPKVYTLTLSQEELDVIMAVLGKISGPKDRYRDISGQLYNDLWEIDNYHGKAADFIEGEIEWVG